MQSSAEAGVPAVKELTLARDPTPWYHTAVVRCRHFKNNTVEVVTMTHTKKQRHDSGEVGQAIKPEPYVPRDILGLGVWTVGPLRLKAYGITWRGDGPNEVNATFAPTLVDAARSHVVKRLPGEAEAEGHQGLGFAVLHEDPLDIWLLMDWWAHGDMGCQLLSRCRVGGDAAFEAVHKPYFACVWEMVVINHERNAWVDTILTERPNPEAYLDRWLPPGRY